MAKVDTQVASPTSAIPICVSAWLIPGMGHFMLRKRWRAIVFLAVVLGMFSFGLALRGELFSVSRAPDLLTLFAAIAQIGTGLPYFIAKLMGLATGDVTAVTYEYGKTFCIVAGLLNSLIVLDAYDVALGRKQ